MEDRQIVQLFWQRSEKAIAEAQRKFGRYCFRISYNILGNDEDAEECVNDALSKAWHAIPPSRPEHLSAFLGKITRNLSLDRAEKAHAEKRGGGQVDAVLDELLACLPDERSASDITEDIALRDTLNAFLRSLPPETRILFLQRYWYLCSIKEIAVEHKITESKVKMRLLRTRKKLKEFLEKEGIGI